jgi:hypothetical protein
MNMFREFMLLLRNTALVTAAVVLGFMVGGAIGIPGWLQGFCLLPAGYLYFHLSDVKPPSKLKIVAFMLAVSAIYFVFHVLFPNVPSGWRTFAFLMLVMFAPIQRVTNWLEQLGQKWEQQKGR